MKAIIVTAVELETLNKIQLEASAHHSALSLLADRAVETLGIDLRTESYEAGVARSIVEAGLSVEEALRLIAERQAMYAGVRGYD